MTQERFPLPGYDIDTLRQAWDIREAMCLSGQAEPDEAAGFYVVEAEDDFYVHEWQKGEVEQVVPLDDWLYELAAFSEQRMSTIRVRNIYKALVDIMLKQDQPVAHG